MYVKVQSLWCEKLEGSLKMSGGVWHLAVERDGLNCL